MFRTLQYMTTISGLNRNVNMINFAKRGKSLHIQNYAWRLLFCKCFYLKVAYRYYSPRIKQSSSALLSVFTIITGYQQLPFKILQVQYYQAIADFGETLGKMCSKDRMSREQFKFISIKKNDIEYLRLLFAINRINSISLCKTGCVYKYI